jgi:outer membrane protein
MRLVLSQLAVLAAWSVIAAEDVAESPTRQLALMECIQLALEHNLDLKIARYDPQIARLNLSLAYAAYEPSLNLSANHNYSASAGGLDPQNRPYSGTTSEADSYGTGLEGSLPTGARYDLGFDLSGTSGSGPAGTFQDASGGFNLSLSQPLLKNLWIDSARSSIQVNKKTLKTSELDLARQIMDLVTRVENAYYDLLLARENIKAHEEAVQLAERQLAATKKLAAVGRGAEVETKQTEVRVASERAALLGARGIVAVMEYRLKQLLSDDFSQWEKVGLKPTALLSMVPETISLQESLGKALTQRPDLQALKLNVEKQGIELKYRRNQLFPQLDLRGTYGQGGSGQDFSGALDIVRKGDAPQYSIGVVLTVPLGNRRERHTYSIAKMEREKLLLRLKKAEQDIMVEVGVAVQNAQTAFARLDVTRQSRQAAEAALAGAQKRLESGKGDTYTVLQMQRDLTDARLSELASLAGYNKALADVAYAEGTTLERHKLNVEFK